MPLRTLPFYGLLLLCLWPAVSPPLALALGLGAALLLPHPFAAHNKTATHLLLQGSIVALGFGMAANQVFTIGWRPLLLTAVAIAATLGLSAALGRWLRLSPTLSALIGAGTAICGGSAIAALAPVLDADEHDSTVALGSVFLLNALGLFLFPWLGQQLGLSQAQFGLWAALAIHDTSSVVGAAARFGTEALQIATLVKLQRALWIVPLTLGAAWWFKKKQRPKWPWFIAGFALAVGVRSLWGDPLGLCSGLALAGRRGLTVALFLVGAGFNRQLLAQLSPRPLLQAVLVWLTVSVGSLWSLGLFTS